MGKRLAKAIFFVSKKTISSEEDDNQKVIEETPSTILDEKLRNKMGDQGRINSETYSSKYFQ